MSASAGLRTLGAKKARVESDPSRPSQGGRRRADAEAAAAAAAAAAEEDEAEEEEDEEVEDEEEDEEVEEGEEEARPLATDGGKRAQASAKKLLKKTTAEAPQSYAEMYFSHQMEKKPRSYMDQRLAQVLKVSELPNACNGSIGAYNPLMWKHGDFVLRLIVDNHLDDTELSLKKLTINSKSLRRDVGAIAKRCAYEEKVKRVLQAVFFEGTSMQLEPPKTGEMFWLIEHMTTLVDTMVRFFLALRSSTVEDLYRHSVYWRSEYSFKAEKLETLVLEAESKNKMKTRATLYDETRYLPHRRESVKKMAPT